MVRLLALCVALWLGCAGMAFAQEAGEGRDPHLARVAVLDVNSLLNGSKPAEHLKKQLKDQREKYQKDLDKLKAKLKKTEEKLVELRAKEDAEGFAKERKEFQEQFQDTQKKMAELEGRLDKAYAGGMDRLREAIVEIVADISDTENYDLVISRQEVVIVSKDIDMTEAVMERLNKELPKIPLSFK